MPARSKAQQKTLFAKANRGEIPMRVAEEFAVKGKAFQKLPEHVAKVKKKSKK